MRSLLIRLHTWVGLFNFTALLVFAITGIAVTWPHQPRPAETTVLEYAPAGDLTDAEVARDLFERLALPLTGEVPEWALGRDAQNRLTFQFYTPNGPHRVTVLEPERQVRIEHARTSFGQFMNLMHSTTLWWSAADWRIRLWAVYVDLSVFSLLFMTLTGVWLWITSRPRLWWAWSAVAAGTGIVAVLWMAMR
jgi:hypothetical protein